jgi:hypothetical protein
MYRRISSVGIPFTDKFTDGFNPSVCHTIINGIKSVGIFQARDFFFWRAISVCKTIGKCFFFTDIAMEYGITDERKADGRILSVNKLPMKS